MKTDKPRDTIQTVDDKGAAVVDRLETVEAARQVYSGFRQKMIDVARADARVMALHSGTPPYRDSELRGLGQGWRANLNLREMKGIVNNRADTAYDLHMEIGNRIKTTIRPEYREQQSANPLENFGEIISEEYTYMLNFDWPENYLLLDQISRDRIKLGLGVACWKDELDWRPIYMPKYSFFTDTKYKPIADSIPACVFRDVLLLQDILPKLEPKNRKAAQAAGWDVDELRKVVLFFFSEVSGSNAQTEPPAVRDDVVGQWAAFEAWRASRPSGVAVFELSEIPVVRYLMKAADSDDVSHYIDIDPAMCGHVPENFLFKKIKQFKKMSHALWLAPYSFAEGTVGSLDGLGHDLAPYCEISNRMLSTALDGGMMSGGLLLQAEQGWDADELSVLRMGPTTVVPPGLKAVQSSLAPSPGPVLELRMALRGVYANNVGMTRMNPELMEQSARGTRSVQEVVTERQREFRLENNSANFEYMMWTNLHQEIFRRAMKAAKRSAAVPGAKEARAFRARCINRGVPAVLLDKFEDALFIEVNRAIGGGSPESRELTWKKLMDDRGSMDEAGRRHVEREYTATLIGYRNVDAVRPLWTRDTIPSNERSFATLENNDFREGSYVPAGSDQIHVIHLGIHFEMLSGMVKTYDGGQEQPDHEGILRTFAAALPNCQEHIQFLAMDKTRENFVKRATIMLKQLVVFYRRVEAEANSGLEQKRRMDEERQKQVVADMQARMNDETAVKMREVELKAQLEAMKQDSLAQIRTSKTEAANEIKRMGAEMRAQLEREIAERRIALEEEMVRRKADITEGAARA